MRVPGARERQPRLSAVTLRVRGAVTNGLHSLTQMHMTPALSPPRAFVPGECEIGALVIEELLGELENILPVNPG